MILERYSKGIYEENIRERTYTFVNAHINNISFPKTIDELRFFIYEHGCFNVEDVIEESQSCGYTIWTVPRTSAIGDIVLYYHASSAIQWISKLETEIKKINTVPDKDILLHWLLRARVLYKKYGGKIFAIGKVEKNPEKENYANPLLHFKSRIYTKISEIKLLETPIDIADFRSFITISRQSAITPLPSQEFNDLRNIILQKNKNLPSYFLESKIANFNLSKVNYSNFLQTTKEYRTRFILEIFFRSYYVNYFIKALTKHSFYSECLCHTTNHPLARVDNVIKLNGKYVLLEVKLNLALENNIIDQLDQYILAEYIFLTQDNKKQIFDFENEYMLVIDMFGLYKYEPKGRILSKIVSLDDINTFYDIENIII